MRKNFMLSLTAMAALPMAGFADATWSVPADNSSITDWAKVEGTDLSSSSTEQIIGIGAGISQKLTLVKGKYTVTVAKLSNAEFAIRVGDKTYSSGEQFELKDETNTVTLKVTTKDATKQFTVGGISVKLIFDFDAAKSNLYTTLNTAVGNKLANAAEGSWQEVLSVQKTAIEGEIAALAEDKETYETAELYKTPSKIGKAIQHLADCIAVLEAFDGMDANLTALTTKIDADATSKLAKEEYKVDVTELETAINTFKAGFDYSNNYEKLFTTTTKEGWLDAVNIAETGYNARIAALSTDIDNANDDAAAFAEVKAKIEEATAFYYAYQTTLKFENNADYATLSKKALDKLAAKYRPIVEQKDITCSLGYRNDKVANLAIIEDAETKMSEVETTFEGYHNTVKAHFVTVNGYAERVAAEKTAIADDKLTVDNQYVTAAETAIQAAKGVLEEAMKAVSDETTQNEFEAAMPSYTDLQAAVEVLELNVLLASAQSYYNAAKAAVAEMVVEGKYNEAGYWTIQTADFEENILNHAAITSNTNKDQIAEGIKSYYFKNRATTPNVESGSIYLYLTKATASFEKYKAVTAAIADWTNRYNAVNFVTNPTVPFETTTYGDALAAAMDQIEGSQTALNTAVATPNTDVDLNAHASAMAGLSPLGTTYPTIFSATKDDYTAAKNLHELPQTIASAKSLAAEVEAKADAVIANLRTAYNTYNGQAAAYGKRYDEIWGGDEATADATKNNFWGIRKRYYNVAGVNANGDYTAVATADNATYDVAIANITTLKEHRNTFVAIDEAIKTLNANAEQIKAAFDANNTAYTEFVASWNTAKTKADEINTKNTDGNRTDEFTSLYNGVIASLDALEALLGPSKNAETFIADRDNAETGFKATLDGINADITKHIAAAEASSANLKAKEDWLAQIIADLYETDGTTKKTVDALDNIALVDNPGHTYFAGVVTQLAADITTLENAVQTAYENHSAKDEYDSYGKGEITRIADGITAAVNNCTTNDDNYKKLDDRNKEVEEFYIKIYYKISETGQITDKDKWLNDLAAVATVDQEAIDADFAAGKLSDDNTYQGYDKLYTNRKFAIEQINADWIDPTGYLASVAAANDAEYDKVTKAYNAAVKVYLKAIDGLKPFLDYNGDDHRWNVDVAQYNAAIFDAKKALDEAYADAKDDYDTTSEGNAELTGETVKDAQYFKSSKYYSCTINSEGEITSESGTIYLKREAISTAYTTAINALNADTKTQLTNAINSVESNVNTAIDNIDTWIYGVYQDEVEQGTVIKTAREKFFYRVDTELDAVKALLNLDQLAVNYLNSKGTAEDYDVRIAAIETTKLTAALDYLALAQYNAWIADKEAKHTELYVKANEGADKGLFDMYPAIAENYTAAFETAETILNDNLASLGTDFTPTYYGIDENGNNRMASLRSWIYDFDYNNGYNAFKNAIGTHKDSEAAYLKFVNGTGDANGPTYVGEVQSIIDGTASYAPEFIAAAATIAGVQSQLDNLKAKADEYRATDGMAYEYEYGTLLSDLNVVKTNAEGLKVTIIQEEYDALVIQLANLKSDYNQALTEENKESEDMKKYHDKILGYETDLDLNSGGWDLTDTTKDAEDENAPAGVHTHTYDKLLDIQNRIIADRNALAGARVDVIYNQLLADLDGLTDRYNKMAADYETLYDFQKESIQQSRTPFVEDQSTLLLENIETSKTKGWILIDEASLKTRIDAWKGTLTTEGTLEKLENAVTTAKTAHDADVAARTRLQEELQDIKDHVTELLENELFQQFKVKDAWSSNYTSWWYENVFIASNEADINSVPTTEGELKDQDPDNPTQLQNIDTYTSYITNFERNSYYSEVDYRYYYNNITETGEYTSVYNALYNIANLLNNVNIVHRDQYLSTHSTLNQQAQAAMDFIDNLCWGRYTDQDIKGEYITNEAGIIVGKYYDHETFVGEDVPAAIDIFVQILKDAEMLKSDIQKDTYKPGNIDQDENGNVSLSDFAMLQYIILGHEEGVTEVQKAAADLNNDDRVDISDLMKLVQMILTPNAAPAPARVRVAIPHATTDDALSIIVEGEGVHQRIGILLDAEQTYAGCQMDITLPEGVTLAAETTGEMAGALSLLSNDLENGSHRILLSSAEGAGMNTGKGALLWLDVNVDHNYNGEGISLSNVLFANSYGRAFELAIAAGETTGLSNVSMTQEVKEKIYNVGGILMDGLKRGVNIIRGNDGSSKKVIVK